MAPVTLLVLDGWGISAQKEGNAILNANTPNYLQMLAKFPNSQLDASGMAVGLPPGLMGNSEVGHLNIGAGRVVVQKLTQISQSILDGSFFNNPVLVTAFTQAGQNNRACHLMGLLSDGCVHSSLDHLDGLIEMAKRHQVKELIVHPILDGRDTPPKSAAIYLRKLQERLADYGQIGTVCGRYYAMDRDNRWERIEKYWQALVLNQGLAANSALEALEQAYARQETDEFVLPTIVNARPVKAGDIVLCFNFRPDRVRQISRALTQADFGEFKRCENPSIHYVCLTEYDSSLNLPVAFNPQQLPAQNMENTLPELLSCHHIGQLHTAETEKYAHVTYFFNGGKEAANQGEDRVLVPSLKVATYDLAPAMQTAQVSQVACQAITAGQHPFIILNFANPDMVGHTGKLEPAIEAVQSVDAAFAELLSATQAAKGTLLITADHGNVEAMIDLSTGEPHTAHTTNPVPFIVADFSGVVRNGTHLENGSLANVAPTILDIMQLDKPSQMTASSLLKR